MRHGAPLISAIGGASSYFEATAPASHDIQPVGGLGDHAAGGSSPCCIPLSGSEREATFVTPQTRVSRRTKPPQNR